LKATLKHKHYYASVKMVKPFTDYWLHPPTHNKILEALASLIQAGALDNHFKITQKEAV